MTNEQSHDGRIALVTGANKGIGREVAGRLAALGMTVLVGARDADRGAEAVAALRAAGGEAHAVRLDVTDPGTARGAAEHVAASFGRLDVLVNNAGIPGALTAQAPSRADLTVVREVFETNVFGVITVTAALLPLLRRSAAGRIVNVSSSLGSCGLMSTPGTHQAGLPPSAAYVPSKSALNALTVQYAKELRDTAILVNAADPGPCATDFTAPLGYDVPRTAADGATVVVRLATLGADGPTGGYFNEAGSLPW
ncbi:SDR family NAD(P)-dependent oxidoreductase [Actinoallomurus sp. CA-150999]|uniref:SDR family NAD(P)-dependent oxidoreductase n=1 Tax=Actinoallomurus sp. CA-150999 TaxID=3239887 RepID=UPI003D92B749